MLHHHQQHRMALALKREGQLKGDSCDVFQSHSNDQTDCLWSGERAPPRNRMQRKGGGKVARRRTRMEQQQVRATRLMSK